MRKSAELRSLFPATRQAVLTATLMHPERWWYLSDLARHMGTPPSSLQRELAGLSRAGILEQRREGNRVYYRANAHSPLFPELRGLIAKTTGLVEILRAALAPHQDKIDAAFVYGSIARAEERGGSDVDLFVVGSLSLARIASSIRRAERELGRTISVVLKTPEELKSRADTSHFVREVLAGDRLLVSGDPHVLEEAAGRRQGRQTSHVRRRDRRAS